MGLCLKGVLAIYYRCFSVNMHAYVSFVKKTILERPLKKTEIESSSAFDEI